MQTPGSKFLHERNPNLHTSAEVEHVVDFLRASGEAIPNNPADKISAHLGFLASRDYVNDGILTGDQSSIDRQVDAHVIRAEDVPEGYFELQRRIAREQGRGDVQITSEMRRQMVEAIQADQKAGLNKWVEYLGGNDGGYPDWFKTYTWNSVVKLGSYDKEKQEFQKRSKGTTAAYPELNREALAYVYDALNKSRVQGEMVDGGASNEQLRKLLKGGNFGNLYAHAVLEVTPDNPELRNEVRGSWTKFNQTDDPRTARRLSGSLQGHGTGWCTAGESTASMQLRSGDFYVYYTRDEDGKDTVPRVAIRMEEGEVAEVRGINSAQELEPVMADITAERLKDLPGGEAYIRKAEDMKRLTTLEKKITAKPDAELKSEEVRFLYELDHQIEGFGYEEDPRIKEIRAGRGDRDKLELARTLPESIHGQLKVSYAAYKTVAEQLGGKRHQFRENETALTLNELEELFSLKDREWRANGVYDYLIEKIIESGARFSLLVTPNIEASEAQIVGLAENFSKGRPHPTHVYDKLYRKGHYTDREWSGNGGNAPVRLSLVPNRVDDEISHKPLGEQIQMLQERQARRPELNIRVPSLLDAVTYWYNLRAQGDKLDNNNALNKTYITHIDLEPKNCNGLMRIPQSGAGLGMASLSRFDIDNKVGVRLSVG